MEMIYLRSPLHLHGAGDWAFVYESLKLEREYSARVVGLSRRYPAMQHEQQTFIEEDIRNIVHRTMTPESP